MLLYGIHTVNTFLQKKPQAIKTLYIVQTGNPRLKELERIATAQRISIQNVVEKTLLQKLGEVNHQGVMAEVKIETPNENEFFQQLKEQQKKLTILILDGVQDPHNLGACIRNADAFGASAVIIPKDNSCAVNETVHRVASGATANVPVLTVTNLTRAIEALKQLNFWIYGFSDEAKESIYQIKFSERAVLVLGSEGKGIRKLIKENCDVLINIPMQGIVSSINVSAASAISLFELSRQLD